MAIKNESNFVSRVNQLDAIFLNDDIYKIFRNNILDSFSILCPVAYSKIKPELELLIQSGIWLGSVGSQCCSFGQKLLMLSYDQENLTLSRLFLHFGLTVLPLYIKSNAENRFINKEWLQNAVTVGEHITLTLSIVNFFRFLKIGKKPSLIDLFLGLDVISLKNNQRNVGYKYMTRELIWAGFMELIGLLVPFINIHKINRMVKSTIKAKIFSTDKKDSIKRLYETQSYIPTVITQCGYCGERPTLPHHTGCCGVIYCYYCLYGNLKSDSQFCCVKCGVKVQNTFELC